MKKQLIKDRQTYVVYHDTIVEEDSTAISPQPAKKKLPAKS